MLDAKRGLGATAEDEDAIRSAMIGAVQEFAPHPEQAATVETWRRTRSANYSGSHLKPSSTGRYAG